MPTRLGVKDIRERENTGQIMIIHLASCVNSNISVQTWEMLIVPYIQAFIPEIACICDLVSLEYPITYRIECVSKLSDTLLV